MWKSVALILMSILFSSTHAAAAASTPRSGEISLPSGLPDKDMKYEDFHITEDGFITGSIVNSSNRVRKAVHIDMWTTNKAETRILWRKNLSIGDLGPHEKRVVREPYAIDSEEPERTEIKFRLSSGANFRN